MYRCLQLARAGAGWVAPNPMVGAVLVHDGEIIGEGYHRLYGEAHAEVNCIASVQPAHRHLISKSVLYVSLEPCAHYGKTPPCTQLIIHSGIPKVVIGCRDPFPEVNGKGIEQLLKAGVSVTTGVLEKECLELNTRFFKFHTQQRPYIVLKWAQSGDGAIAMPDASVAHISNSFTNRMVHRWRSEEQAILIGTRTAMLDNPSLTTRLWPGRNPIRLVIDRELKLPHHLQVFDKTGPTIIFNEIRGNIRNADDLLVHNNGYYLLNRTGSMVEQLVNALYQLRIQSVLVEGGAKLLQSFIDEEIWDEARIITNDALTIPGGIAAPTLNNGMLQGEDRFFTDRISFYVRAQL